MIDRHLVNLNIGGKREGLSLPKESCQADDVIVDHQLVNFVKMFGLFKSGVMDDLDRLKQAFFLK